MLFAKEWAEQFPCGAIGDAELTLPRGFMCLVHGKAVKEP